jgi:outer membrane protein assembly factor BamE (lipoprotein component of BamABCDE complex)
MFKKLMALLVILGITACAAAGHKIDRTHLGEIQNGVQTKDQIRAWFGEPYTVKAGLTGHPSGCVERWTYEYAKARGRAGTVTYSEILVVDFDKDGKVCDHAFSQSGTE